MPDASLIPKLSTINFSQMTTEELCDYLDIVATNEAAAKGADQVYLATSKSGPTQPMYSIRRSRLPQQTSAIASMIINNDDKVYNLTLKYWYDKDIEALYSNNTNVTKAITKFRDNDPSFDKEYNIYKQAKIKLDGGNLTKKARTEMQAQVNKMENEGITPKTPGAMRSWHQNDAGFLPMREITQDTLSDAPKPAKALMYHNYIVENIGLQNKQKKKGVEQTYTGYIEYQVGGWSTAIQDGRICYDYYQDLVYFTATHYQQRTGRENKNPWWHVFMG